MPESSTETTTATATAESPLIVRTELSAIRERRATARVPYDANVAVSWLDRAGTRSTPVALRTLDISFSGISVISRQFVCPGTTGIMQIVRRDGRSALLCVVVATCQSIDSLHYQLGLEFGPLPPEARIDQFQNGQGVIDLMDEALLENIQSA